MSPPFPATPGHRAARRTSLIRAIVVALAATLLLPAAASRAEDTKAAGMDPALMTYASELAFAREVARVRAKRGLDRNNDLLRTARRATNTLLTYAPRIAPESASWSWEVHVETREEPVAWCMPGGKVMVSTGLVDRARLTPPEVVVIVAHAIAHALAGHDAAVAAARFAGRRESPDPNRQVLQLAEILMTTITTEPHAMEAEREADALAFELMARTGLDPAPAVEAWRKIARAGGATPPGFLSLHEVWRGRIEEIDARVPAWVPIYDAERKEQEARREEDLRKEREARARPGQSRPK
jgi:Zn-dependent protease with chaperone function